MVSQKRIIMTKLVIIFLFFAIVLIADLIYLTSYDKPIENYQTNYDKMNAFYASLQLSEKQVYSQNNEDGVIEHIMKMLNISSNGYYVEFGCGDGTEINTRYLRENFNWTGLLMTGSTENSEINLHKEMIMHWNITKLFKKYNVPTVFDLFSEDTDYADYWIVESVLKSYRPKVIIHEVNQQPGDTCVTVPKENNLIFWDGSNYHGASVCAFHCLAKKSYYTMVYCESKGVNCFWIRNDLLTKIIDVTIYELQSFLSPTYLFKKPGFEYPSTNKVWEQVTCAEKYLQGFPYVW